MIEGLRLDRHTHTHVFVEMLKYRKGLKAESSIKLEIQTKIKEQSST